VPVRRPKNRRAGVEAPARTIHFEDAVLVRQVQAGDLQAYAHLVSKYQDKVYNTCCRICGNLDDAADVTQEAFLKALESIGSFRGASSFYTWVFRIAVNLALTNRRKATRHPTLSIERTGDSCESTLRQLEERVSDDPSGRAGRTEMRGLVAQALQNLDDEFRAAVVLRDIEGFNYDEIAEILSVPKGTVKSRIARGRRALRDALAPVLGEDAK
jgi:RNA polymerase sigma-70 factor (ECF subfamily)